MSLYRKKNAIQWILFFFSFHCTLFPTEDAKNISVAKRPLNILFVVGHFPSPSQTFILNIITGLIDLGHNVSIFAFRKDIYNFVHPNVEKYDLFNHITYQQFPKNIPNYDIVFCQFGYTAKKIFKMKSLATWLKKRKMAVCFRGFDLSASINENRDFYRKIFKKGHLFLPVCEYFKNRLIQLGCDSDKIVVHHSAINCSDFSFKLKQPNETINIISVCRLVPKKGMDFAIRAVARVLSEYPNIRFTIVGEGSEQKTLEKLITELNLQDKVFLYGWKSQREVASLLSASHIFLLPSRTASDGNEEGIPNALKEAMAMGLISVGTYHAGIPELIDNDKNGFLVPQKNVYHLAQTIKYIIEHPEKWEAIALQARKTIEDEFEIHQSVIKLEKLFYALVNGN
jgi:colanic acid/amylovoran biosynthesis glycosyltransferase